MTADISLISIPANAKPWLNPIPNLNSVNHLKLFKTGCVAAAWLKSVSETVIAHKMLSHWNCLLLFGICSMFPKGNGSEYDKNCCHEKKQR